MFYFIALAGAHKRVVEQLREQLIMVRFDPLFCTPKVFFVVSVIRHAEEQHSLLDTWCLHRPWKMFYKLHRKNNRSTVVFLSLAGFLRYQLQLQQGLVISGNTHAWDTPLRSGVPVLHLLSCLNPPICMFFSCQTRTWILGFLSPPPSYTTPASISFTLTNKHPTPYPSLQVYLSSSSRLVLFLSAGPSTACNRHSEWSKSPLTSPLENGASADMLLCGHQKLLPCSTAFIRCDLSNSALVRT